MRGGPGQGAEQDVEALVGADDTEEEEPRRGGDVGQTGRRGVRGGG